MPVVSVDLIECLFQFQPAPLQFDLDQRQAVDQQGYVVAIFIRTILSDLGRNLILVPAPFAGVHKLNVEPRSILAGQVVSVAQRFRALKHIALVEMVHHPLKFSLGERDLVMHLKLDFEIGDQRRLIGDGDAFPTAFDKAGDQACL